jgi:hypothetical protein
VTVARYIGSAFFRFCNRSATRGGSHKTPMTNSTLPIGGKVPAVIASTSSAEAS